MSNQDRYDREYFSWQGPIGEFGGWANLPKFEAFIRSTDHVLDFGCGGGYLLSEISCAKRIGVEINRVAARVARENGIEVYSDLKEVPNNYVDVAISNHALEHTKRPLDELEKLRDRIRSGGLAVFVVPCETISMSYSIDDVNHHLYSWSPQSLGNLFTEAGYDVIEAKPYQYKWPPGYKYIARLTGRWGFSIASWIYGHLERSWSQVRVIAQSSLC